MKKRLILLLAILPLILFQKCGFSDKKFKSEGLTVTGKVGEILVVCEPAIWNSEIKHYLDSNLTQFIMPYFPDVATFELIHKAPTHFEQGVRRYRNTLILSIDPNFKGSKAEIKKRVGVWATDQLVVDVIAKDFNQLLDGCKNGLKAVHAEFDTMEWKRIAKQFRRDENYTVQKAIQDKFGIDVALPEGARIVSKRTNFFRIEFPVASRPIEFVGSGTQEAGAVLSGIMIYQYDYKDSSQFVLEDLLKARDTMLKYNVPHEVEGLYMGTQYSELVYPEGNAMKTEKGDVNGYEVRGMYVFTGRPVHTTGGAFWAFHFVHPKSKKLMCVSGYVDAPSTTSWTQSLREIQAVLKSVEILK
jgi:hypothetical protein